MKSISKAVMFSLLITILASCSVFAEKLTKLSATTLPESNKTPEPVKLAKVINHKKPGLQLNFLSFSDVEKCDQRERDNLWGGLTPNYPILSCIYYFPEDVEREDVPPSECFQIDIGFQWMSCQNYVIAKDGNYQFIRNMDEFRAVFAPVDSPEEALAFGLMSNNDYSAIYGLTRKEGYVYYTETIEDTHVDTNLPEGYIVHIFDARIESCGPFYTYAVDVKVSQDGQVKEINRYPIYRDPSLDTTCVD